MTKEEVFNILVLIESVYSYCITTNETVMLWFQFYQEMDYQKVMKKLQAHIRKSPFPPSIAELAVFIEKEKKSPDLLDKFFLEERGRIEWDKRIGHGNQVYTWMQEYIAKTK